MTTKRKSYSKQFKIDAVKPVTDQGNKISEAAKSDVIHYIEMFYNSYRLHSYLEYRNPNDFEKFYAGKSSKTACPFLLDRIKYQGRASK